jgi:hypothetical protein
MKACAHRRRRAGAFAAESGAGDSGQRRAPPSHSPSALMTCQVSGTRSSYIRANAWLPTLRGMSSAPE